MELEEIFGNELKKLRKEKNLSQEQVAEKSGFHVNYISFLERGINQPSLKSIFAIAAAFEMRPEELVSKVAEEYFKGR